MTDNIFEYNFNYVFSVKFAIKTVNFRCINRYVLYNKRS